jgi:MoaA/NifB/PqqE/SkfB family radical SAM enzyme
MDPDVLKRVLKDLEAIGTRELIFAGEGEPLLYPHFFEAVSAAKSAGMKLNVITNGTLLTEELIGKLIDLRLDLLTVSLWASSEEEYERLYPGTRPDFFRKVLDALKRVSEVKAREKSRLPLLRLHRPISRDNFRTVETALEQARAGGCDQLTVAPIHSLKGDVSAYKLSAEEERDLFVSLSRMKSRLRKEGMQENIDLALQLYRIGEAVWDTLPCYVGWVHSRIRIDGTVFPCGRCDVPMGDLGETAFHRIWNGEAYRRFRRTVSTRKGLASMKGRCVCGYCCHIRNSVRVHRVFRWVAPAAPLFRQGGS